jgi:hypothetical protein
MTETLAEKKLRILLLMSEMDQYYLQFIDDGAKYFSFVRYKGALTDDKIQDFLQRNTDQFDVVAAYNIRQYDDLRAILEKSYEGPKILFESSPREDTPHLHAYARIRTSQASFQASLDTLIAGRFIKQ